MLPERDTNSLILGLTIGSLIFGGYLGIKGAVEATPVEPVIREIDVSQTYSDDDPLRCLGEHTLQVTLPDGSQHVLGVKHCDERDIRP